MRKCGFSDSDRDCEESCRYWSTCARRDVVWGTPDKESRQDVGRDSEESTDTAGDSND